jgi:hypothetical protein
MVHAGGAADMQNQSYDEDLAKARAEPDRVQLTSDKGRLAGRKADREGPR